MCLLLLLSKKTRRYFILPAFLIALFLVCMLGYIVYLAKSIELNCAFTRRSEHDCVILKMSGKLTQTTFSDVNLVKEKADLVYGDTKISDDEIDIIYLKDGKRIQKLVFVSDKDTDINMLVIIKRGILTFEELHGKINLYIGRGIFNANLQVDVKNWT